MEKLCGLQDHRLVVAALGALAAQWNVEQPTMLVVVYNSPQCWLIYSRAGGAKLLLSRSLQLITTF
jgi:hypothetical protein